MDMSPNLEKVMIIPNRLLVLIRWTSFVVASGARYVLHMQYTNLDAQVYGNILLKMIVTLKAKWFNGWTFVYTDISFCFLADKPTSLQSLYITHY
jgi:hypothetical protein